MAVFFVFKFFYVKIKLYTTMGFPFLKVEKWYFALFVVLFLILCVGKVYDRRRNSRGFSYRR